MDTSSKRDAFSLIEIPVVSVCRICGERREFKITIDSDLAEMFPEGKVERLVCERCGRTRAEADAEARRTEEEEAVIRRLDEAGIPPTFREYDKGKGNKDLCAKVWANRDKSMYICGAYSCGKTRAVCNILQWCIRHGDRGTFRTFGDLADTYAELRRSGIAEANEWLDDQATGILVLDDLDKRKLTGTAGDMLFRLFDRIYNGTLHCHVWVTSNTTHEGLYHLFDDEGTGIGVSSRIDRMILDGRMAKVQA